jgi:hypothetical protein
VKSRADKETETATARDQERYLSHVRMCTNVNMHNLHSCQKTCEILEKFPAKHIFLLRRIPPAAAADAYTFCDTQQAAAVVASHAFRECHVSLAQKSMHAVFHFPQRVRMPCFTCPKEYACCVSKEIRWRRSIAHITHSHTNDSQL